MKIIHMSDIHGDMESFDKAYNAIKEYSEADVLAITGDIAMGLNREGSEALDKTQKIIYNISTQLQERGELKGSSLVTTCDYIEKDSNAPDQAKEIVNAYRTLIEGHEDNSRAQYEFLKERINELKDKKGIETLLVPGEWDTECLDDYLSYENLHLNKKRNIVKDIGFVGYGSARAHPGCIPLDNRIPFDEVQAYHHLTSNQDAEIALIHAPVMSEGNEAKGQEGCMSGYLVENTPTLILEGHSHIPRIQKIDNYGTFISNPGNLGRREGKQVGMFYEWDINKNLFANLEKVYKIKENGIEIQKIEKVGAE